MPNNTPPNNTPSNPSTDREITITLYHSQWNIILSMLQSQKERAAEIDHQAKKIGLRIGNSVLDYSATIRAIEEIIAHNVIFSPATAVTHSK